MLGVTDVVRIESEAVLLNPRWHAVTDVDLIYHQRLASGPGISIVQIKAGRGLEWAYAARQLKRSAVYVQARYGIDPDCYYAHYNGSKFRAARIDASFTRWTPVGGKSSDVSDRINRQFPHWRERYLPGRVALFGAERAA